MKIGIRKVSDLKPDKNQPRKTFNNKTLKDMAQTLKNTGIVEPIKIDENNVIIVGERRWRASKIAGLKKVPVIIKEGLSKQKRREEQLIEDIQKEDIPVLERARAWQEHITLFYKKEFAGKRAPKSGLSEDKGFSWLADRIGQPVSTISNHIGLIEKSSQKMQKAIEQGVIKHSYAIEANRLLPKFPKEHKLVELQIFKGVFKNPLDVRSAVNIVKNQKAAPKVKEEVLSGDLSFDEAEKVMELPEDKQEKALRTKKQLEIPMEDIVEDVRVGTIRQDRTGIVRDWEDVILDIKGYCNNLIHNIDLILTVYKSDVVIGEEFDEMVNRFKKTVKKMVELMKYFKVKGGVIRYGEG